MTYNLQPSSFFLRCEEKLRKWVVVVKTLRRKEPGEKLWHNGMRTCKVKMPSTLSFHATVVKDGRKVC